MDWIAANGRIGTVCNIPPGMAAGSDVAILSVLGYDPADCYTGRAPLEAAARGIEVGPEEWVLRCNLVTIIDGIMEDHCAGHISTEEATAIIDQLRDSLQNDDLRLYRGVAYRHLLVASGPLNIKTTPPHDILGEPVGKFLPTGKGSKILRDIMTRAHEVLARCEVNDLRREMGENLATDIWLWGQGTMPTLANFAERFGLRAAAITAVDLIRGLSKLIGWDVLEVEGATGFVETNYAGKGDRAVSALDEYDLVFVHVEAPDEAGHNADLAGKLHSLEQIDLHVVGPVLRKLQASSDEWRIMVLPDHPTPIKLRTHTAEPVPFAIAGAGMEHVLCEPFTESSAQASDLHIDNGCDLMEYFLTVR
jgi:2,3-bisphosphoglycerate-independent phosphoglycerate mutase